MSLAFFRADDVKIEGPTKTYPMTADSGNINTRHFCPNCGGRIATENSGRPGIIGVTIGTMDETGWFAPQAVVYTKSRPGWDATSTSVPNFEGMPPIPAPQR